MTTTRPPAEILAEWRLLEAEQETGADDPELQRRIDMLRAEHRTAVLERDASAHQLRKLPRLPVDIEAR